MNIKKAWPPKKLNLTKITNTHLLKLTHYINNFSHLSIYLYYFYSFLFTSILLYLSFNIYYLFNLLSIFNPSTIIIIFYYQYSIFPLIQYLLTLIQTFSHFYLNPIFTLLFTILLLFRTNIILFNYLLIFHSILYSIYILYSCLHKYKSFSNSLSSFNPSHNSLEKFISYFK